MTKRVFCAAFAFAFAAICLWPCSGAAGDKPDLRNRAKKIVVFDFRDAPLVDVLKLFTEMTGNNVVATPEILDKKISLYLEDVDPLLALEVVCKNHNLWYTTEANVIRVMKVEEYGRELVLRRDERTQVFNLRYASCVTVAEAIANIFGKRVQYNEPNEVESYGHVGTDDFPDIGEEVAVSGVQGEDAKVEARSEGQTVERGGVTFDKSDLSRLGRVMTGGKITTEELLQHQIGQARALLSIFPRNNAVVVRSVDSLLLEDIAGFIQEVDTPTREVLLEAKILEIELDDGQESFFNIGATSGSEKYSVDTVNSAAIAGSTLNFTFIDAHIQADLQFLETTNRGKKVATPIVFCANNAAVKFFQGVSTPLRKGYTTQAIQVEGTANVVQVVQTDYSQEEIGVTLELSPSINQDGTVTLKIIAKIATLNTGGGPPFNYVVNNQAQVGATDSVTKTEIEDIIVVKNGQSLAIGGLIQEQNVNEEEKVPLLGDIPLIGLLFRKDRMVKERKEIIFVITPHIILNPDSGGRVNDTVMRRVSDHPFYHGQERVMSYDAEKDTLEAGDGMDRRWRKFPWNLKGPLKGALIDIDTFLMNP